MLNKRLIFILHCRDGIFHLSRNFVLQKVGGFDWVKSFYHWDKFRTSIDELVILNVGREVTPESRSLFCETLQQVVQDAFMPVSAGGNIRSMDDAALLFGAGADKVVLNRALFYQQELVKELVTVYGSQAVVASVDYCISADRRLVVTDCGRCETGRELKEVLNQCQELGVGEFLLQCITRDGTGQGIDLGIESVLDSVAIPVIVSGGVGKYSHICEALARPRIEAVATANLFNFIGQGMSRARATSVDAGISLAAWDYTELSANA